MKEEKKVPKDLILISEKHALVHSSHSLIFSHFILFVSFSLFPLSLGVNLLSREGNSQDGRMKGLTGSEIWGCFLSSPSHIHSRYPKKKHGGDGLDEEERERRNHPYSTVHLDMTEGISLISESPIQVTYHFIPLYDSILRLPGYCSG